MYSVIIPTLWKSNLYFFRNILLELDVNELVGEIIIIDNDPQFQEGIKQSVLRDLKKVNHVRVPTNLFVNPSWNLGASLANYEYLAFINDDVWSIPSISLALIAHFGHSDKEGVFGLATECFVNAGKTNLDTLSEVEIKEGPGRGEGWGCFFIIKKIHWEPIPDELKIWCGDDFITTNAIKQGRRVYLLYNLIVPEYATTVGLGEFTDVKEKDLEIFLNNFKIK
jgi:hypothetical protein